MDWKTDSDFDASEDQPYSTFQSNRSGRLLDRLELPIILTGAGLLALIILFVLFIPRKNEVTIDDYKHIVSRLDQLEDKIDILTGKDIDVHEFDPAEHPVQYQQLVNWIKSNAEVISETIKKVDAIEKHLPAAAEETKQATSSIPSPPLKVVHQQGKPAASAPDLQDSSKREPGIASEPIEKSKPVKIQSRETTEAEKTEPEATKRPATEKPIQASLAKPADELKTTAPRSVAPKPETYKLIFHRVEKGETLYRISRKYGISVETLQALNDMKKDDLLITVGQELIVRREKQN